MEPVPPMVSPWTRRWGVMSEGVADSAPSATSYENANFGVWQPIYVPTPTIVRRMWWANGSSVSAGYFVEAGIYYDGGHKPGAKLCTTDLVAQGTASQVQFANLVSAEARNPYDGSGVANSIYGGSGTAEMVAQSFTVPNSCTVRYIRCTLQKSGTPTDNLSLIIESTLDGGGTSASIAGASLTTSAVVYTLDLGESGVALSSGTTYYLRFARDGSRDTGNYFQVYRTTRAYADGVAKTKASGSWSDQSYDFNFGLFTTAGANVTPTLTPGLYWLYISCSTTSATFLRSSGSGVIDELIRYDQSGIGPGSAPDTATPTESDMANYWLFGFTPRAA